MTKKEYIELKKISNRYDAIHLLAQIQGFDEEDDDGEENMEEINAALKQLRFKALSDLVGFFAQITEEWRAEVILPDTPFTEKGTLRAGWRMKEIDVLSIHEGRRSNAKAKAFVKENHALVEIKEWKAIA